MASRKTETDQIKVEEVPMSEDPWQRKQTVYLPKNADKYDSEWVCVNGRPYLVPKGKPVEVPLPIAEAIENAAKLRDYADAEKKRLANG